MLIRYGQNADGKRIQQALVYTKKEHNIQLNKIDAEAIKIIKNLHSHGYETYIVGGAVRDLLIGKIPKDFDITTSAEPSKIRKIFKNSRIIGKRFRLVHVFFGNRIYEVSTFRSTEYGSVGNKFGTIAEDVHRRDFTLNALYYDPIQEVIIDYVNGVKDIKQKKIKPIIPLKRIFCEDPVRIIRAIKYASTTDSKISFLLQRQIKKYAYLLEFVSPSRITEEINKILLSGFSCSIVEKLLAYNLYDYIQPSAVVFIDSSAVFKNKYLERLKMLDEKISDNHNLRQGECLKHIICDYIKLIANPEELPQEVYNNVYSDCRRFVLPMNPQRKELEFAVKSCLNDLGINICMEPFKPLSQFDASPKLKVKPSSKKKKSKV